MVFIWGRTDCPLCGEVMGLVFESELGESEYCPGEGVGFISS